MRNIILASASPRRRELMQQVGLEFEIRVSNVEEVVTTTVPCEVVLQLSSQKAEAVAAELEKENADKYDLTECLVLGADTIVSYGGVILGKPKDTEQAKEMLRQLSGKKHEVYTGVTFVYWNTRGERKSHAFYECTQVEFAEMTEAEIQEYVATKDPLDKAGSYGIQGFCARYIKGISGDYNNVVGLPVGRVYQELKSLLDGID